MVITMKKKMISKMKNENDINDLTTNGAINNNDTRF